MLGAWRDALCCFLQMLEAVKGPVYGLNYEKGDSQIIMAGYKLAAAKLTASSALGCLAAHVDEPEVLGQVILTSPSIACLLAITGDRHCNLGGKWAHAAPAEWTCQGWHGAAAASACWMSAI